MSLLKFQVIFNSLLISLSAFYFFLEKAEYKAAYFRKYCIINPKVFSSYLHVKFENVLKSALIINVFYCF